MKFQILAAFLMSAFVVGCDSTPPEPPKSVMDQAVMQQLPALKYGSGGSWETQFSGYTVANTYTRKLRDESFQIYEIDAKWTEIFHTKEGWQPIHEGEKHFRQAREVLAFVKRGNSWYWRKWNPDE